MERTRFAMVLVVALGLIALGSCQSNDVSRRNDDADNEAPPNDGEEDDAGYTVCEDRRNDTPEKLRECVTVEGLQAHLSAFQRIADENGGNRSAGTAGYEESVGYVVDQMERAGYEVEVQQFEHPYFEELSAPELEQVAPVPTVYQNSATDGFATMTHSGSGEVSAPAQGVDLALGTPSWPAAPAATTSACEASDFTGFIPGNIAVVQAGACEPSVKVENAVAAGAAGVVMAGQGHSALGMLTLVANLGGTDVDIPVVGASHNLAAGLAGATAVRLEVNVISETRSSENVLAETPTGDPDNVVMVGGHLDSVPAGPGINDNGSGSAAILETAIQMKRVETRNKVRFAWWGAEEPGLLGSQHYVDNLDDPAKDRIAVYLNFDMVGSLNYVFGVYDGNESTYAQSDGLVPAGSADVEKTFEDYFDMIGVPHEDTAFTGRSDYGPFIAEGIPSGGLLSGADGIKTLHDAAIYGGMVGKPHDPCYHRECDNSENVSLMALDINSDAVAHATLTHAMSTTLPG